MSVELDTMVRGANPVPTVDDLPEDELGMALMAIETRFAEHAKPRSVSPFLTRMRSRPQFVFAAAMAIVVLAVAVPLLLVATRDGEVAETTSIATTVEPVVPPTAAISWTRVPDQPAFENAAIGALSPLVEGGPGLVAVGNVVEGFDFFAWEGNAEAVRNATGAVFVSTDGLAWERVDLPWDSMGWVAQVHGVASGLDGTLVAVGNDGTDAVIWASSDGLSWDRVSSDSLGGPDFQNIVRVVPGGPGFVAVGNDGPNAGVWVSPDGFEWSKVEDQDLLAGNEVNVSMAHVEVGGPGLVAVGSAGLPDGDGIAGAAWVSQDGYQWDRLPTGTFAAESGTTGLESVTAHPVTGRLIAFGSEMWTSADGYNWVVTERDLPTGGPVAGSEVAWHDQSAVAAGFDARYPAWLSTPWVSNDGGSTWVQVEPVEPTFDDFYDRAVSVTWFNGQWIVAGQSRDGGVIWIGTPEE